MKEIHVWLEHLTETPIIGKELAEALGLVTQCSVILSGRLLRECEATAQSKDRYPRKESVHARLRSG
jgi:hypothetical protein